MPGVLHGHAAPTPPVQRTGLGCTTLLQSFLKYAAEETIDEGYLRRTAKAESVGKLTRKDVSGSFGFPASVN